ncbi:hypothetical protein HY483_04130 [Candidatus Woesearchaeota archaeon]|nr:hypothetical protein [Candidatus Woesearchaeota archaeon]
MTEAVLMEKMYKEIVELRREVTFIKHHMVNADMFLTPKDEAQLEEAMEEHKKGRTISLQALKKGLGD